MIDSSGGGTLDLNNADASGFSGSLILSGGFVAAADSTNLGGSNSSLVFDGGGLRATGDLTIPAGQEVDVLAGGATLDPNGYTLEFDAALGSGSPDGAAGGITVMDSSSTGGGLVLVTGSNICQAGLTVRGGTYDMTSAAGLADKRPDGRGLRVGPLRDAWANRRRRDTCTARIRPRLRFARQRPWHESPGYSVPRWSRR